MPGTHDAMTLPKSRAHALLLTLVCLAALPICGQDETPFTRLFDTGAASAERWAEAALARRTGWRLVPEDNTEHTFAGDAVLLNDKLMVVLRKQGSGAEVYSKAAGGLRHRATVGLVAGASSKIQSLGTFTILENTSGALLVEAGSLGAGSGALRFRVTTGEAILEIRPGEGADAVDVQTKTRFVIVPDYFGDDMVYGGSPLTRPADTLSPSDDERAGVRGGPSLCLPAENFCLNLLEGGEAIMMSVWQSGEQDVWLTRAPTAPEGDLSSNRIRCLKGKSIWLAFLDSPGIWHTGSLSTKDDWKPPFPAKWRCSLVRENNLTDSWDWDRGARPDQTASPRQGPWVVYPIDRNTSTPLTASCPTDVMRATLGVGPCQYILACEGLAGQGDPTPNSVMTWVEKQFELKKEKKAADEIQERLEQMTGHVAEARARLEQYARSANQIRNVLPSQPDSDPFRSILGDLDRAVAAGLVPTASADRARQLAAEVSALVGQSTGLAACRRLGEELRAIGAIQDSALAKCRMAVRRLKAGGQTMAATQPQQAGLAREVQRLAQQMLQRK